MIKHSVNYRLNAKPIFFGFYHDYVFEGPCRMGSGVMLTKDYDLAGMAERARSNEENLKKWLADKVNLMPAYRWNRNEEFLIEDDKMDEVTADMSEVDVYIIPIMSRLTDILINLVNKTKKPVVLTPPAYGPVTMDIAAGLRSRGLEIYAARTWEETIDLLEVLRVRNALANMKILCAARFGTSKTPSAGDNLINPDDATAKLGIGFRYINSHELLDQTDICDPSANHTLPGRHVQNPTKEDVAEINKMVDELVAGAEECTMAREEIFHSFRAYYTIKKLLDYYGCNAFCAPCPDICATRRFNEERYTFCMNHSLLNEVGIPSACEYDLCAVISLAILENFARAGAYMGNTVHLPLSLAQTGELFEPMFYNLSGDCNTDYKKKIAEEPENIIFTWHSVPNRKLHGFDSAMSKYAIRPFTGSGWGVTLRHDFNQDIGTQVTMCRLDPSCKKLLVAKGEIVAGRGYDDNSCSLGVFIRVKDGNDFFQKQLDFGNHVPLVYGNYFDKVCALGRQAGLEVVTA